MQIGNEARKVTTMKWYSYIILLLMYIIYLAIGALVFQTFEKPHEVRRYFVIVSHKYDMTHHMTHMIRVLQACCKLAALFLVCSIII